MIDELRMAELLCTRLCHDLTGPIGAVNNGAEFLREEGFNLQGQAVELITSSAFSAVTRLQFYRASYGRVKDHGEANLTEKQKLASDFFSDTKIKLDWPETHTEASGVSVSLKMTQLVFNLLIIASGALIRGGGISVRIGHLEGKKQVIITAEGPGFKWDPEMEKILADQLAPADLNPKNVQMYFTKRLGDEIGAAIACRMDGEKMLLELVQ